MKQIDGQIDIFQWVKSKPVKPCECGNCKLAIRYTGCGTPIGGYKSYPLVFEHFLYCLFCPECWRVATTVPLGWRSNKLTIKEAVSDWNNNPHRIEKQIEGKYGLRYFAEHMDETYEMFPDLHDYLY